MKEKRRPREKRELILRVLREIEHLQKKGRRLPPDVFEAHLESKKNLSTIVAVFNARGRVFLIKRPGFKENPSELYPNQLHFPGVTHMKDERLRDTLRRLAREEGLRLTRLMNLGIHEVYYRGRGLYVVYLFAARARGRQANPRGKFFDLAKIPRAKLIVAERKEILPVVKKFWNASVFASGRVRR